MRFLSVKSVVLLGLVIYSTSGCQYFKSAVYSQLDRLVLISLNEYFDLSDQQKKLLRPMVASHLKWAQQNIIPQLRAELLIFKKKQEPISHQQYLDLHKNMITMWLSIIDRIADDGAWLFLSLSSKQFKHLQGELEKKHQQRYEPVFASSDDFEGIFSNHQEERLENYEKLVGELNKGQEQEILQITSVTQQELKKESVLVRNTREIFFQKLLTFKQSDALAQFFRDWAKNPGVEYEKFRLSRKHKMLEILSTI